MSIDSDQLDLTFGFSFEDLYQRDGLVRLDGTFLEHLRASDPALFERLTAARSTPDALSRKQQSELIIELAPHLEDFIGEHVPEHAARSRDRSLPQSGGGH